MIGGEVKGMAKTGGNSKDSRKTLLILHSARSKVSRR